MKNKTIRTALMIILAMALLTATLAGCGSKGTGAQEPAKQEEAQAPAQEPATQTEPAAPTAGDGRITDGEALSAVRAYCLENNPDLEDIIKAGEYPVYWEVETSGEDEVVVLFRSYTGALVRYYVDRAGGDAYITEFVPGITPQEQRTEENFNVKDILSQGAEPSLAGTWQTASVVMGSDGSAAPEYHVQFTGSEVVYGHMKDGEFAADHSDRIGLFEVNAAGGFVVKAETSDGGQYTYQTSESDPDVLEYYETWNEDEFPGKYRGGASLNRCD